MSAASSVFAQNTDDQNRRRGGGQNNNDGSDRRNFNPQDMQDRMLTAMRERFEVTDDAEWKLISERLTKVMEVRRTAGGGGGFGGFGGFGGRGGPGGGGNGNDFRGGGDRGGNGGGGDRGTRGGRGTGGNTEIAALSAAVRDKMPDAEIKSRLERVRETRKDNEVKLAKAQEDLRAVLTVRQEAMAVVYGLLP